MIHTVPGSLFNRLEDPLTPNKIVEELDKFIIGQNDAKKAVALALRNRIRRRALSPELRDEVAPKNIIMIGPTGVGKTEIARRLARLTGSPFLKIEASKFTEVGYVGRDVESMIRDLAEISYNIVKAEKIVSVQEKARRNAEERVLDLLVPTSHYEPSRPAPDSTESQSWEPPPTETSLKATREKMRDLLHQGKLDDRTVEVELPAGGSQSLRIFTPAGMEEMGFNLQDMLPPGMLGGGQKKTRKVKVGEAIELLLKEEEEKLVDQEEISQEAVERAEQSGIIFLDEIDKVAGHSSGGHGPDVSREGVQRDLLPIVEGSRVNTRYGLVRTDHILFVAAGAFHMSKPSDLLPELQGRFPIRVELQSLSREDFVRILQEPQNALILQYIALLATEGVEVEFTPDAVESLADFAALINDRLENIGARRLHTVIEKVMEEVSFNAPELAGTKVVVDKNYVGGVLKDVANNDDLSKYIL
ncbi:MAG: ATP-dependent protease ATPase subunit HslU [Acidobacteriota bacterium]